MNPLPLTINPNQPHALLDRREAERVPLHSRVSYLGEEDAHILKGEGTLRNLSKTGCLIIGTTPLPPGSIITLLLHLERGKAPMRLAGATVTWVVGQFFGVKFPPMASEERKRLQEIVWKHVTLSGSARQRAAFRIV